MAVALDLTNLTTEDLTRLLPPNGVKPYTTRVVQKWCAVESMPHHLEGSDLRFDWHQALKWFLVKKFRGDLVTEEGGPAKSEVELRLLQLKAEREARRLAVDDKTLLPVAEIEPAWLQVAETVKNRVLTIKSHAAQKLPHLTSEDIKVLDTLCWEALEELSKCQTASQP